MAEVAAHPSRGARLAAALVFVVISLSILAAASGERSGYVRTFVSYPTSFGLYGYSFTVNDAPMMAENQFFVDQTLFFAGAGSKFTMYFTSIRPLYAFLATLLAPLTGVIGALAGVNWLSWLAAALVAWRFTKLRTGDNLAALIAVVLVTFGLGFTIHIHDYSPHLFAFALYYAGTLLVFETGVWRESRPWTTHFLIGSFLAVSALAYSTGLTLTLAYALVAARYNRWYHVVGTVAIALSSQTVWTAALNVFNGVISGRWAWQTVNTIEQGYMAKSLSMWWSALSSPAGFLRLAWDGVLQFGGVECPLLIVVAIACWFWQRRSWEQRWFEVVFAGLPVGVGLVYLNYTTTRGYLSFGLTLILYAVIAQSLGVWLRAPGSWRVIGVTGAATVLIAQMAWSTAYFWDYLVPAKMFFGFGFRAWIPQFIDQFGLPVAMSLTDAEPTPILFGGRAPLREAGVYALERLAAPEYSVKIAIAVRAVLAGYIGLLAIAAVPRAWWRAVAVAIAVVWLLPAVVTQAAPLTAPRVVSTFEGLHVPPQRPWRYSIDLGDEYLNAARAHVADAVSIDFMLVGIHPPFTTRVTDGNGREIASADDGRGVLSSKIGVAAVLDLLTRSKRVEVTIDSTNGTAVFGWQRAGLPGRRLTTAAGAPIASEMAPAFEIRMIDRGGRPILIGF